MARDVHIRLAIGPPAVRWLLVVALVAAPLELGSETLTLTTTYPPPAGIYNSVITTGNNASSSPGDTSTILNRDGGNTILLPPSNASCQVGIGAAPASPCAPGYKLDVQGGNLRGSGYAVLNGVRLADTAGWGYRGDNALLIAKPNSGGNFRVQDTAGSVIAQFGESAGPGSPPRGGKVTGDLEVQEGRGYIRACAWATYGGGDPQTACGAGRLAVYVRSGCTPTACGGVIAKCCNNFGPFSSMNDAGPPVTFYPPTQPASDSDPEAVLCCRFEGP